MDGLGEKRGLLYFDGRLAEGEVPVIRSVARNLSSIETPKAQKEGFFASKTSLRMTNCSC
jgi:hypothetical protein